MPLPVKSLPLIQNWDCHGCGDCCKTYHVRVSEAEKAKIEAQDWSADPELKGLAPIVWDRKDRAWRLNHTADGSCVFLTPDNRCRIQVRRGSPRASAEEQDAPSPPICGLLRAGASSHRPPLSSCRERRA